ncbi:hypothetical protein ACFRAQ_24365 [Nocardia sp. NPDC056611]|uniref:hypothetical protein n=1 Tax=Nocardia sp. NPDC056611 TaxID=3345877 RepID=UPI0036714EC0
MQKVLRVAGQPFTRTEAERPPSKFRHPERLEHAWHLSLNGLRRGEMCGLRWPDIVCRASWSRISLTPARRSSIFHWKLSCAGL